jgi:hypothetical protein
MRTHVGISNKGSVRKNTSLRGTFAYQFVLCSSTKSTLTAILSLRLSKLKHIRTRARPILKFRRRGTRPIPDAAQRRSGPCG